MIRAVFLSPSHLLGLTMLGLTLFLAATDLEAQNERRRCPERPGAVFVLKGTPDPEICSRVCCRDGEEFFQDACGCGCEKPPFCPPGHPRAQTQNLHYPDISCAEATSRAIQDLSSHHYRSACQKAHGGDLPGAVLGAEVRECRTESNGAWVDVEVCCPERELPPECPSLDDPEVHYQSRDPEVCAVIRFACPAGYKPFSNTLCGCGCEPDDGVPPPQPKPRLTVKKTLVGADERQDLTFQLDVRNVGQADYPAPIVITDTLPPGTDLVGHRPPEWSCVQNGTQVTCTLPKGLAPNVKVDVTLVIRPVDRLAFAEAKNCATVKDGLASSCVALPCPNADPSAVYAPEYLDSRDYRTCADLRGTPCPASQEFFWGICGCGCRPKPECAAQPLPPPEYYSRVATRRDAAGRSTLIVTADSGDGSPIDEVRLELGRRAARDAEPLHLPPNWSAVAERDTLIARGPALAPPVFLKFGVDDPPAKVDFKVHAGEREKFDEEVDVERLEPVAPAAKLDGLLAVPRGVIAGEVVGLRPLDPAQTPPEGQWSIGGQVLPIRPWPRNCFDEPPIRWPVPVGLLGGLLAVTYIDPWGDEVVAAKEVPVEPVEAPEVPAGFEDSSAAVLEAATEVALAGGQACGCGVFTSEKSRTGLLFDGQPLGVPAAAGPYAVHFQLPASLEPGSHELRGDPAVGVGGNTLSIDIIEVRASIDQSALRRGGSTQLRLEVVGSERPVDFEVYNNSPQIIRLEGGDRQNLTTSGGSPNALSVTVQGVGEGDFDLGYEVQLDPCPCE